MADSALNTGGQPDAALAVPANPPGNEAVLPVHAEHLVVSRRQVETGTVRVSLSTQTHEQRVEQELTDERVEVERVPVGRTVESAPPVRYEGDTTIYSVVEEVLVVERRLVLKEEVRVRRVITKQQHSETVTLREQIAVITRTPHDDATSDTVAPLNETSRALKGDHHNG